MTQALSYAETQALSYAETQAQSYAEHDLAPLQDLLRSEDVNEVVINPDGQVWVERAADAHMRAVEIDFPATLIKQLGQHIAAETSNPLGDKAPIVSGRIKVFGQSMRVQILVPPVVESGVSLSVRKYVSRVMPLGQLEFLHGSAVDVEGERLQSVEALKHQADNNDLAAVFSRAIEDRLNIVISGGTSSGKTTVARALLGATDLDERLVTIEDAAELQPPHANQVAMIADRREDSVRSPAILLESALRMRPDRLILGEIRGTEALNFLEAINTGHPGSITTVHADSPALALERIALMVMRSGIQMTRDDVLKYARGTIDMIVQVGRKDGRRGVLEVSFPRQEDLNGGPTSGDGEAPGKVSVLQPIRSVER